ncbi:aggregation factor core [Roseobacteraceae bacterium S113]
MRPSIFAIGLVLALPAQADISVKFVESAPKDRFQIINLAGCAVGPVDLKIDLSKSAAGLIFDTSESGAGVEVFQPFELVEGRDSVAATGRVGDGDTTVSLKIAQMPADGVVAFTIDVDDTMTNSELGQIRVSGSEISGAEVSVAQADGTVMVQAFDARGRATVALADCMS